MIFENDFALLGSPEFVGYASFSYNFNTLTLARVPVAEVFIIKKIKTYYIFFAFVRKKIEGILGVPEQTGGGGMERKTRITYWLTMNIGD